MIDPTDKKTQELPLETKRGRGRPSTGKALSPAEKQKAYRERIKGNVTDNSAELEALRAEILELKVALGKEVQARKKAEEAAKEKGNVTDKKELWWFEAKHKEQRSWKRVEEAIAKGEAMTNQEAMEWLRCGEKITTTRYRVVSESGIIIEQ